MNKLSARIVRLETASARASLTVHDAIDRPPQETREEWIARRDGLPPPDPPKRNSRGETRGEWIARRHRELELELELCKDDPQ
jgi:hypothetical protein